MCARVCVDKFLRSQGTALDVTFTTVHFFLRQGLSLTWISPSRLGRLANELQGLSYLHFPSSEIPSATHLALYMDPGN